GLGDEVEVALARLVRATPQRGVLGAEERIARALDGFQDVPGGLRGSLRDGLAAARADQVGASPQLLELGVREHEDLLGTPHDGDGGGRLHEERVQMLAMRVGLGPGPALAQLHLVALAGELARFLLEGELAAVLIEEEADLGDHRLRREGLHHVVDGTLGVALDDLLLFAADGGDEDDRRVARALPLADERGSLESVEVRHLYVEEDEGAVFGAQEPQRLAAGARLDEPLSARYEHRFEREQLRFAIVDVDDGLGSLRLGRVCY